MAHTIREARKDLSNLVREARESGREVQIGRRGEDEVTIIASSELKRLRAEFRKFRTMFRITRRSPGEPAGGTEAPLPTPPPYAGLTAALRSGELKPSSGPVMRRRIPNLRTESSLSFEEQARIGRLGNREPRFRRSAPLPDSETAS